MNYADEDLKRAGNLIAEWVTAPQPGIDIAQQVRSLCLAFMSVRRDAFERAALTVEACPVPADDIPHTHLTVIAQRIRGLK